MLAPRGLSTGLCALVLSLSVASAEAQVAPGGAVPATPGQAPATESATIESLGRLEREAVQDALEARGLRIDPAPAGKRVGVIHVVNHEVFSKRDSYTQLLNVFHRTTRESIIRREVLLDTGDLYSAALVEETVRNLRDADFSSLVVLLPVVPPEAAISDPARVDLLVVTRDVWSLRFNTEFDYGEGVLRALSTSLSENNLLGWRKKVSFAFNLRRGSYAIGPSYLDPNVAGTRLTFSASFRASYSRETNQREGASIGARLVYPLFSLASRWGAELSGSHSSDVVRDYFGNNLRLVDLAATPMPEALPYIYRRRYSTAYSGITRSFGSSVIQRVSTGYSFSVVRPSFLPDFPAPDQATREAFAAAIFPRSERLSSVYLAYNLFTPRYRVYRDYETYDLREDALLGPSFSASVSRAAAWLGSDDTFTGLNLGASWTFDWLDGRQHLGASWNARLRNGNLVDRSQGVSASFATPVIARAVRLIADGGVRRLLENTRREVRYSVGAETGLRGYATGEFQGQASYVAHVEARSRPLHVATFRLGMVAFYDVGHAAPTFASLTAKQDVGAGLRLLIPQLNFYVLRVDWAFPLQTGTVLPNGSVLTRAGWPGRVSAGFRQAF
ncbi:MAG TPA: hypothetical protein VGG33_23445 [Polyangia bacterium]